MRPALSRAARASRGWAATLPVACKSRDSPCQAWPGKRHLSSDAAAGPGGGRGGWQGWQQRPGSREMAVHESFAKAVRVWDVQGAKHLYDAIAAMGSPHTPQRLSQLARLLCEMGRIKEAASLLSTAVTPATASSTAASSGGITPGGAVTAFATVIEAASRGKDLGTAMSLFHLARELGVCIDLLTCEALLEGVCAVQTQPRSAPAAPLAADTVARVVEYITQAGMVPSEGVWRCALTAAARAHHFPLVLALLRRMGEVGARPRASAGCAVIEAVLAREAAWKRAQRTGAAAGSSSASGRARNRRRTRLAAVRAQQLAASRKQRRSAAQAAEVQGQAAAAAACAGASVEQREAEAALLQEVRTALKQVYLEREDVHALGTAAVEAGEARHTWDLEDFGLPSDSEDDTEGSSDGDDDDGDDDDFEELGPEMLADMCQYACELAAEAKDGDNDSIVEEAAEAALAETLDEWVFGRSSRPEAAAAAREARDLRKLREKLAVEESRPLRGNAAAARRSPSARADDSGGGDGPGGGDDRGCDGDSDEEGPDDMELRGIVDRLDYALSGTLGRGSPWPHGGHAGDMLAQVTAGRPGVVWRLRQDAAAAAQPLAQHGTAVQGAAQRQRRRAAAEATSARVAAAPGVDTVGRKRLRRAQRRLRGARGSGDGRFGGSFDGAQQQQEPPAPGDDSRGAAA